MFLCFPGFSLQTLSWFASQCTFGACVQFIVEDEPPLELLIRTATRSPATRAAAPPPIPSLPRAEEDHTVVDVESVPIEPLLAPDAEMGATAAPQAPTQSVPSRLPAAHPPQVPTRTVLPGGSSRFKVRRAHVLEDTFQRLSEPNSGMVCAFVLHALLSLLMVSMLCRRCCRRYPFRLRAKKVPGLG